LLYYHGNVATPTVCTDGTPIGATNPSTGEVCGVTAASVSAPFGTVGNTDFDFSVGTFRNNFDRYAAYASYPLGKHFLPQGGFSYGRDTNPNGTKFDSKGAFAEGAYSFNEYVTAGLRYDWFRPRYPLLNTQWAITPYINIPLQNGLQFIAEYQHRDFQLNASNHRQNDTVQVRLIFIW
jgi:outer membrane receptor protein involved in Fe transport